VILRKIRKFDATRCQILRLKCTKFDFSWGSAPDPAGGAYSALTDPLGVFNGPTSQEREGVERREERESEGKGRRGGRRGKGICRTNVKLLPSRLRAGD